MGTLKLCVRANKLKSKRIITWDIILNFCKESVSNWQSFAYESGDLAAYRLTSATYDTNAECHKMVIVFLWHPECMQHVALFCVRARSSSSCAGSEDNIVGTFKLRDFNSKMGRMTNSDRDFGFSLS